MTTRAEDASQAELLTEGDRLYDLYVKPLEEEHWGEFVAVAEDGVILRGETLTGVMGKIRDDMRRGIHVFMVGPRAVGRFR